LGLSLYLPCFALAGEEGGDHPVNTGIEVSQEQMDETEYQEHGDRMDEMEYLEHGDRMDDMEYPEHEDMMEEMERQEHEE
jgi:hypothetical protein